MILCNELVLIGTVLVSGQFMQKGKFMIAQERLLTPALLVLCYLVTMQGFGTAVFWIL